MGDFGRFKEVIRSPQEVAGMRIPTGLQCFVANTFKRAIEVRCDREQCRGPATYDNFSNAWPQEHRGEPVAILNHQCVA